MPRTSGSMRKQNSEEPPVDNLRHPLERRTGGSEMLPGLPRNILHKYGINDCESLLADRSHVQEIWSKLYDGDPITHYDDKSTQPVNQNVKSLPKKLEREDTYQEMSQALRHSSFPGRNVTYHTSHNQGIHGRGVVESHDPLTEEKIHRLKRDELNEWNEIVYLRRKTNKVFDGLLKVVEPTPSKPVTRPPETNLEQPVKPPQEGQKRVTFSPSKGGVPLTEEKKFTKSDSPLSNGKNVAQEDMRNIIPRANTINAVK